MPHEELPSLQRPRYGCKYAACARLPPALGSPLPRDGVGEAEGAGYTPRRERERSGCGVGKVES